MVVSLSCVIADVYSGTYNIDAQFLNTDNYTFFLVLPRPCPHPYGVNTVPMQITGSSLALEALGLLSIISGAVYGKLR